MNDAINDDAFLNIVLSGVRAMIPEDDLTEEQLYILDRVFPIWVKKEDYTVEKSGAYVQLSEDDVIDLRIYVNHEYFFNKMTKGMKLYPDILLPRLMHLLTHEIVHILYQTRDEEETDRIASDWLNRFDWKQFTNV